MKIEKYLHDCGSEKHNASKKNKTKHQTKIVMRSKYKY